jgi:uncharacterized protein (TIGR03067 family)
MISTLMACLLVLANGAEDSFNEAARKELKALEGNWVVERIEAEGKKLELGDAERAEFAIKGRKWTFSITQEKGEIVALDPSCNPKLIDLKNIKMGREAIIREGIYKIDGDTLTIAVYQGEDKKRPTNFDTPTETGTILVVFKHAKR